MRIISIRRKKFIPELTLIADQIADIAHSISQKLSTSFENLA